MQTYDLTIQSNMQEMERVIDFTEDIMSKTLLNETDKGNFTLCVSEILDNAMTHGNKAEPLKNIWLRFEISDKEVRASVRDEGAGFEPAQVEDPRLPNNLEKDSGRGMFIVETLMDDIQYDFQQTGTEVTIVKKIQKI